MLAETGPTLVENRAQSWSHLPHLVESDQAGSNPVRVLLSTAQCWPKAARVGSMRVEFGRTSPRVDELTWSSALKICRAQPNHCTTPPEAGRANPNLVRPGGISERRSSPAPMGSVMARPSLGWLCLAREGAGSGALVGATRRGGWSTSRNGQVSQGPGELPRCWPPLAPRR